MRISVPRHQKLELMLKKKITNLSSNLWFSLSWSIDKQFPLRNNKNTTVWNKTIFTTYELCVSLYRWLVLWLIKIKETAYLLYTIMSPDFITIIISLSSVIAVRLTQHTQHKNRNVRYLYLTEKFQVWTRSKLN